MGGTDGRMREDGAADACVPRTIAPPAPSWERRDELGVLHALYRTALEFLFHRRNSYRTMATTGGMEGPLLYAIIMSFLAVTVTLVYEAAFRIRSVLESGSMDPASAAFQFVMRFVPAAVILPVIPITFTIVFSAAVHAQLRASDRSVCFEPVFRIVCYAMGTALCLMLVPVPYFNFVLGLGWFFTACVTGVREVHRIGTNNSITAVFEIFPTLAICAGILGPVWLWLYQIAVP